MFHAGRLITVNSPVSVFFVGNSQSFIIPSRHLLSIVDLLLPGCPPCLPNFKSRGIDSLIVFSFVVFYGYFRRRCPTRHCIHDIEYQTLHRSVSFGCIYCSGNSFLCICYCDRLCYCQYREFHLSFSAPTVYILTVFPSTVLPNTPSVHLRCTLNKPSSKVIDRIPLFVY